MTTTNVVQTSFLSGVLDPRAKGRIDTDAYNNGLLVGTNIEPIHLGGVQRRRGLRYCLTCPNKLTRITSGSSTAVNGGTANNAADDSEVSKVTTTVAVGTTNPYVVYRRDLGSVRTVYAADVTQIYTDGGSSVDFCIQYSQNDSAWTTLGTNFTAVDTTTRAYRRVGPIAARYWRVARIGTADMGSAHVVLADLTLWTDSGVISEGRVIPFEVSTTETYLLVLTDRSAIITNGGVILDQCPSPYTSADLAGIDAVANAETMIVVHENYPPRFFVRDLSSPITIRTFAAVFDAVPQIDYADSLSPTPTSDIQTLTFNSGWNVGDTFQITIDTDKSESIVFAGDNQTTANAIATAVQKLWVVQGFTGVSCTSNGSYGYTLTLANASADAYGIAAITSLSSSATATVVHTQTGVARREPAWSATRGYARSVEFFEGRLYFGGLKSQPQSLIGSQINNILQFDVGEGLDDDPVYTTLNGRNLNAFQGMFAGRSFQLFTSGGEFRYVNDQGQLITPSSAPSNQTQYGSAKIRPVAIDGSTIFVQRNQKSIRDFRFDYTENAYNSLGVSALSPNLIYDVRGLAAWNGSAQDEINLVFVVNGTNPSTDTDAFANGTCAIYNTRKELKTQAWTIWTTLGEFKAAAAVVSEIYFLVKRTINSVDYLFLEQADQTYYTDAGLQVVNGSPTTVVTGLGYLNGQECRVRADGFVLPNVTPVGGSVTLSQAATNVEIGINFNPTVTPMPLQSLTPTGTNVMRKKRVVDVRVKVRNTLGLLMNGRVLADRYFDINSFDQAAVPFSGTHQLEETSNWDQTEDKLVSFTQVDPLPMQILAIDVKMETS